MNVLLRQSLLVTSIQSTLMLAQSVAHAQMFVLTRQSLFLNKEVHLKTIKADHVVSLFYYHKLSTFIALLSC